MINSTFMAMHRLGNHLAETIRGTNQQLKVMIIWPEASFFSIEIRIGDHNLIGFNFDFLALQSEAMMIDAANSIMPDLSRFVALVERFHNRPEITV